MNRIRSIISVMLVLLLGVGIFGGFNANAQECNGYVTPREDSTTLQDGYLDNCGNTNWELKVIYGAYEWDEGEYDAEGVCTGGYINCNCDTVPQSYKTPTKYFYVDRVDDYDYQWWWNITNYEDPYFNPCTSGNCQSTGYLSQTFPTFMEYNVGWDEESCYL